MGATVNNQWLSSIFGYCGEDNHEARELCSRSLKNFFGPGRPYVQDQTDVYARLLELQHRGPLQWPQSPPTTKVTAPKIPN